MRIAKQKSLVISVAALVITSVWIASARAENPESSPQPSSSTPAEQIYKNIQVLKGVPSDQLIPTMQFISASLGVECGFCHVERHFDKDDKKPKQIARKMMKMITAINQSNFDSHQEVTCNTCHRGSRIPVSIPAISEGPPKLRLPETDENQALSNLPSPGRILAKYMDAIGGAEAIEKLTSLRETGTAEFAGRQVPVEVIDQSPDRRLVTIHLPGGDSLTAFNGKEGWLVAPHRPVHSMSSGEMEGAKLEADLQLPLHLEKAFEELRPSASEEVGDHDCYVLIGETAERPRARFYFDQQSGLLVRMVQYAETALGLNPTRLDYSDFRPVNGVQIPYHWTVARPAGQFTVQINEATPNPSVDPALFSMPAK
jgi:photosynthetic reaction center cytochrome c subunit